MSMPGDDELREAFAEAKDFCTENDLVFVCIVGRPGAKTTCVMSNVLDEEYVAQLVENTATRVRARCRAGMM